MHVVLHIMFGENPAQTGFVLRILLCVMQDSLCSCIEVFVMHDEQW